MLFTPSGRLMLVRALQPLNAEVPIFVTPSGRLMLVRAAQPSNAQFPMLVIPFGSVMTSKLAMFSAKFSGNAVFPLSVAFIYSSLNLPILLLSVSRSVPFISPVIISLLSVSDRSAGNVRPPALLLFITVTSPSVVGGSPVVTSLSHPVDETFKALTAVLSTCNFRLRQFPAVRLTSAVGV